MARYGQAFRERAVARRLPPESSAVETLSREIGVSVAAARISTEITRHKANLEALPREQTLLKLTGGEVSRLQDLVKRKVGAQSALDTALQALEKQAISLSSRQQSVEARLAEVEAARDRAEALRDQAQLELERTTLRAPFNGRIAAEFRRDCADQTLIDSG